MTESYMALPCDSTNRPLPLLCAIEGLSVLRQGTTSNMLPKIEQVLRDLDRAEMHITRTGGSRLLLGEVDALRNQVYDLVK